MLQRFGFELSASSVVTCNALILGCILQDVACSRESLNSMRPHGTTHGLPPRPHFSKEKRQRVVTAQLEA